MQVTIKITRETEDESRDIEVAVEVEVDGYGVRPAFVAHDKDGCAYVLSSMESDKAAEIAREEAAE